VLTTEPGFMSGHEVVKIQYDPTVVSEKELANYASLKDIKPISKASGYRFAQKDHYYQLQQTDLIYLPLTDVQKTKINAGLHRGEDVTDYLSPKQLAYYQEIKQRKRKPSSSLYTLAFAEAWGEMK